MVISWVEITFHSGAIQNTLEAYNFNVGCEDLAWKKSQVFAMLWKAKMARIVGVVDGRLYQRDEMATEKYSMPLRSQ